MRFVRSPWLCAALIAVAVFSGTPAQAQDMQLLTDMERQQFNERLSKASDSAMRARIKSEMNRLIQIRKLEQRKQQKTHGANQNTPQGPSR